MKIYHTKSFIFIFHISVILALTSCGPNAKKLELDGNTFFDTGNYTEAIITYTKAIEADPKRYISIINRGSSYFYLKKFQKALEDFLSGSILKPNDATVQFNIGLSLFELGQYEDALEAFNKTETMNLSNPNIDLQKANCHFQLADFKRASSFYSKAIPFFQDSISIYFARGTCFYQNQQYQLALIDFKHYLSKKSSPQIAIEYAALSAYYIGDFETSISFFDRMINNGVLLTGDNLRFMVKSLVALGSNFVKSQDKEAALELFSRALLLEPNSKEASLQRGLLFIDLGQKFEACTDLSTAFINGAINAGDLLKEYCPDY